MCTKLELELITIHWLITLHYMNNWKYIELQKDILNKSKWDLITIQT